MRCTTTSAVLPTSATTRACSTRSSPPCATWKAGRRSPGGRSRRNGNENWKHERMGASNPLAQPPITEPGKSHLLGQNRHRRPLLGHEPQVVAQVVDGV